MSTAAGTIFEKGLKRIRDRFAVSVVYRVGNTEYKVAKCSMRQRRVDMGTLGEDIVESTQITDFLIGAEDLPIDPQPGDMLRHTVGEKVFEYQVIHLDGERCWRWSDPINNTQMRIHTILRTGKE